MLTANQQEINLGKLEFGKSFDFKFVLTNKYSKPVTILSVDPGCKACTQASASKLLIPPNDTVDINVKYTPGSTGISLKGLSIAYSVDGEAKPSLGLKFKSTA